MCVRERERERERELEKGKTTARKKVTWEYFRDVRMKKVKETCKKFLYIYRFSPHINKSLPPLQPQDLYEERSV